jgi:acyl-coenzyme A thioesterase PaaI-like protein
MIEEKFRHLAETAVSAVEGIARTGIRITDLKAGYAKCVMPLAGNTNHVGIMYAGSLFTLGEIMGGIMWGLMFDVEKVYPIVKDIHIQFKRPAMSDVMLEMTFDRTEADQVEAIAEKEGKSDYTLDLDLKDAQGQTVAMVKGIWQIRKIPPELKGVLKISK